MGSASPDAPAQPIPPLDFEGERQFLSRALTDSGRALRLLTSHATTQQLQQLLMVGCRVLHYSGHGLATCLAFESDAGDMHAVDAATLHSMMVAGRSQGGPAVALAFVSACQSEGTADAFLRAGVAHVIAVRSDQQVHDLAAKTFMSTFYYGLFMGLTVRAAFQHAKASVLAGAAPGSVEDKKFLLLPASDPHDVAIFGEELRLGAWEDCSEEDTPHNLQGLPEMFIARNSEMQDIVAKLCKKKRRLLTLQGAVGVGKTALAIAAATYISKRHLFDGVYFIDLKLLAARTSAGLATLCSEAMALPTVHNNTDAFCACLKTEHRHSIFLFIFDDAELANAYRHEPHSPRCLSSFLSALLSTTQSRALVTATGPARCAAHSPGAPGARRSPLPQRLAEAVLRPAAP